MYLKDKTELLQIRVSKKQMDYLDSLSKTTGISKTELIRGYIDKLMGGVFLANRTTN